jgi:TPR repeat protein
MSQNQQAHNNSPAAGADVQPTEPQHKAEGESARTGPTEKDLPPSGDNTQSASGNGAEQNSAPKDEAATEEAKATPPPAAATKSAKVAKVAPRQAAKQVAPAPAPKPASPDADLEQAGERYLYGNGVPQNCARAESSLRTAAMHGNTKAQTVLGTMYATGHCVGRDLPTAYRWFARALHQEPQNSRISADLQVLWRQMTPQEKQLATVSRD